MSHVDAVLLQASVRARRLIGEINRSGGRNSGRREELHRPYLSSRKFWIAHDDGAAFKHHVTVPSVQAHVGREIRQKCRAAHHWSS
jgi:hypothetical protein